MTIFALVSGSLFRASEEKTAAKSGRRFLSATIKVRDSAETVAFVKAIVFSESAQAALMNLQDGDALSVQGSLSPETYVSVPSGETKISLTIFAEQILPLRQLPKQRQVKSKEPAKAAEPGGAAPFDDLIPF
jgi:single-stranded DNA-binding protein